MDDKTLIFNILDLKKDVYANLFNYYDGNHPLVYNAKRLADIFENIDAYFAQNWMSVIVDSALDRLILKGFTSENEAASTSIEKFWTDAGIANIAQQVHEAALVTGESYIVVEKDATGLVKPFYNDPAMCHVLYANDNPNVRRVAGKRWIDGSVMYMNLYYADHVEHYVGKAETTDAKGLILIGEEPMDTIPVFQLRCRMRKVYGEYRPDIISLQDAVNKTLADMMVASEFTAFKQRVIISGAEPDKLKNIPGWNWWFPAAEPGMQPTSVTELGGADFTNFLSVMDKLATSMAIISRTPKHYLFNQGGDPSGDALIAMEAPLNKKVNKYAENFGIGWREVMAYCMQLQGTPVSPTEIDPTWELPVTMQPTQEATVIKTLKEAGVPLSIAVRHVGWDEDEATALEDALAEEKAQNSSLAQEAIRRVRMAAEQGGKAVPMNPNTKAQPNVTLFNKEEGTDAGQ